nr:xylulose kinase-1 [Tanacetum cinerariifolium]
MAALQYKAEHNKVGYLLKPTGSDDYHNIIDFLRSSHIKYALTTNPIIFDSLVKQFWSTATLRAHELGPPAILATIDRTPYTITEDLVRSHLQLADDGGVADLPIPKIYSGMDNLSYGMVSNIGNAKKFLMYPRFLQTILGIETRVTRQYKVLVFSSKLFANMRLNFAGNPMPLLPVMLLQAQAVFEPDYSSDQHATAAGSFPTREDAPLGGDFHTSPIRSSHAPPTGQPLGGAEDPITLTALSSVVSTLVQMVHTLKAELHDHKRLFKDVVGKLVKKVKTLEVKLKTKKRKMVVTAVDSDIPSGSASQIPAASPCAPSAIPPGATDVPPDAFGVAPGASDVSLGAFVDPITASVVLADSLKVPADSPNVPAGVSSKGKSPMIEEDVPVKARTFRRIEEDRLGKEAAKRAQVEANTSLSKTLLGDDVSEDNFPARMAVLIKQKRQALAEQLFKERQNRPLTPAQQKAYMRQYVKNQSNSQGSITESIQAFNRTLKRPGPALEEPSTKRPKSPISPTPSMLEVPISPAVISPPSSRTRRKSLGRKHMHKPKSTLPTLDFDAPAQTFLKVVVDEDSVDEVWSAVVGWEVLSTYLGEINALYRIDGSTKHFTTLRQILHLVDRQDLMKIYGFVVQFYEHHPAAGVGLLFWGNLQVLFDSQAGGKGSCVWQNQHLWEIRSWRFYTLLNVHVLETVSGEVLSMFTDVSYPLSVELMKKMLMHKLEIDSDFVGNNLTTAEQLIQFIKNQIVTAQASSFLLWYVVPTGRVIVPTDSYIVSTGRVKVATGRFVVPAGKCYS